LFGVGVVEGAGPFVVAVWLLLQFPGGVVFERVVVAAEGFKVAGVGLSALGPGVAVVKVAVVGWHPASGVDTGGVLGCDFSF
jgi:hypothetical protein